MSTLPTIFRRAQARLANAVAASRLELPAERDLVEGLILIGSDDEYNYVIVSGLRDAQDESPIVAMSDACEGFVFRRANDCVAWVETELESVARATPQGEG